MPTTAAGWLMMPLAMLLVGLELPILSWLIIESEEAERATDRLPAGSRRSLPPGPTPSPVP